MKNKLFIKKLDEIITHKFDGNVSKYARTAGVGISTIQNYLSGRSIPNSETLEKLAKAAGISKDDLYPGESSANDTEVVKEESAVYTAEEKRYINKVVDILRGPDEVDKSAVKRVIDSMKRDVWDKSLREARRKPSNK